MRRELFWTNEVFPFGFCLKRETPEVPPSAIWTFVCRRNGLLTNNKMSSVFFFCYLTPAPAISARDFRALRARKLPKPLAPGRRTPPSPQHFSTARRPGAQEERNYLFIWPGPRAGKQRKKYLHTWPRATGETHRNTFYLGGNADFSDPESINLF